MLIALFANRKKPESIAIAQEIAHFFQQKKIQVVSRDDEAEELKLPPLSSINPSKLDFLISIGGDGTILRLVHHFPDLQAPILGINLGHLGFMADLPTQDLFHSLEDLVAGRFKVEERIMMEGVNGLKERCFAVNEIVVHRASNPALIDVAIYVDGIYLNTFSADGVIISTPNGSTAYSLSAGGPILTPELDAFVITPISPHTISNRPIVLMPKDKIELRYLSPYNPVEVSYDGFSSFSLAAHEPFSITKSKRTFKMVQLPKSDHFATLRTKLGWTGQVRYHELNRTLEE